MGLKRVTKKFFKYLIPTLLVLLIIPFSERSRNQNDPKDIFSGEVIRCALRLEDKLSDGYQTGYCLRCRPGIFLKVKNSWLSLWATLLSHG